MRRLTAYLIRYTPWVIISSLLLGVIGGYYSVQLYKNLKPDIEELLPIKTRSVQDYFELNRRLDSTDYLAILVFPESGEIGKKFVGNLSKRLDSIPKNILARVEFKINDVIDFFSKRKALYLEVDDLKKIRDYISKKIEYESELYNPLNIFRSEEILEPKIDFNLIQRRYALKGSQYSRLPDGYFATSDQKTFALLAFLPSGGSKIENSYQLRSSLDVVLNSLLNEPEFQGKVQLKFTGGVQDLIEEHGSLIADLELSTLVVLILVTLVIALYFKSTRAAVTLLLSLMVGTLWSFGASYGIVGYLNANSAFLGAIVLGNGINFGIIYLARYIEELKRSRGHLRALLIGSQKTAKATGVAALAAGLSYGSLALTEFRGFQQFGRIGLIAMVLCWLSTYLMVPAILNLMDKVFPTRNVVWHSKESFFGRWLAHCVNRWAGLISILTIIVTSVSIALIVFQKGDILETDLSNLRDRRSEESGSGYNSRYLHQIFQGYPHPTIVLTNSSQESEKVAERLRSRMKSHESNSWISSVQTVQDLIPKYQTEKIHILNEIRALLPPRILRLLSIKDREKVDEFLTPEAFQNFSAHDLPKFIKKRLSEKDGTLGNLVLVEPPIEGISENYNKLLVFVDAVRESAYSVREGIPVAGQLPVSADMVRAIQKDGPRATAASFLAVMVLIIVLFRKPGRVFAVISGLLLGALWLVGMIFITKTKINFLNFIALPITFGIGVDYSVNVYHRFVTERSVDMGSALRYTGGAVTLASSTTIIGYGSLLLAGNRAFVSFGSLATWGELTCLLAALISLPAFIELGKRTERRSISSLEASGFLLIGKNK